MKLVRLFLSTIFVLIAVSPVLTGCGGSEESIKNVSLGFDEAAGINEEGQVEFSTGDEVTAVASIVYEKGGSGKGEWQIDDETIPVSFDLPAPDETENVSVVTVSRALPTDMDGLHSVGFSLTSHEKQTVEAVEYVVCDPPPPANPTSYIARLRVTTGHATRDNESGANWHDELRLLVGSKVWIPQNQNVLPPVDSSLWTAVLPPNGDDFAIQDVMDDNFEPGMDEFAWNTDLTPDLLVDSGKGVTFRTQLWEKDANIVASIFKAYAFVFSKCIGSCVNFAGAGPVVGVAFGTVLNSLINKLIDMAGSVDDFIGENVLYLDSATLGQIYAEGGSRTYWIPFRSDKGEFELNYQVTVSQRNVPAPAGSGVYVIEEYVHDGFSVMGGNTEGGKEELRLARTADSTGGGQGVYSPPGGDVSVKDGEPILWEGAVSEPVRIIILDNGECWFGDRALNPVDPYYSAYNLYEEDPSHNENFGTVGYTLSKEDIETIAASDAGFTSFLRSYTGSNGQEILMNFEIRIRKQPLSERFVVTTYIEGGTNVFNGNTEAGKEELRLTATDVNGVASVYSPPDGDIAIDDDGTGFTWSAPLSTVQIDPIGNGQYGVAGTPVAEDSAFLMYYDLWEEDNSNHEQFGSVRHRLTLGQLNSIAASGGSYPVTSLFEGPNGTFEIYFRIEVRKEINT